MEVLRKSVTVKVRYRFCVCVYDILRQPGNHKRNISGTVVKRQRLFFAVVSRSLKRKKKEREMGQHKNGLEEYFILKDGRRERYGA